VHCERSSALSPACCFPDAQFPDRQFTFGEVSCFLKYVFN
jgi:hypothetical protein